MIGCYLLYAIRHISYNIKKYNINTIINHTVVHNNRKYKSYPSYTHKLHHFTYGIYEMIYIIVIYVQYVYKYMQ